MARGFLSGFVVGTALSVCAAGFMSLAVGPAVPPEVFGSAPVSGVAPAQSPDASSAAPSVVDGDPRRPLASDVDAPEMDDGPAMSTEATRPAVRPETAATSPDVTDPVLPPETGGIALDDMTPTRPRSQAALPEIPDDDSHAAVTVEPTPPAGTDLTVPERLTAGDAEPMAADRPEAPVGDTAVVGLAGAPAPRAPVQSGQPKISAETAPRPDTSPPRISMAPAGPSTPENGLDNGGASRPDSGANAPVVVPPEDGVNLRSDPGENATDGISSEAANAAPSATEIAAELSRQARPAIGVPATSLMDRQTDDDGTASVPADPVDTGATPSLSPLLQHSVSFENSEALPLLSIILMDHGADLGDSPVGLAALDSFPYPLSFAVDTSLPDAAERAARYRAEGLEVMALIDLPQSFTASDTEVALPTLLARIPEAVAVLEGPDTGLQGSAEMTEQVAAILDETGHGIVWQPGGLGVAQRRAERAGVAAQTLFRDFDKAGETPLAIRRFLDQAAFRAGQDGSVIVAGRVRPETITALVIWGLQERAERVAVAPVSAALLVERGGS